MQASTEGIARDIDVSRKVVLKMYLIGDRPIDTDLVYDQVNRLLSQDINATVSLSFLSWGDWQQKYPLIFAADDNFDLIYSANWTQYNQQALKGAFHEITRDMLSKYAPKTAISIYPEAWEQAKVSGKVFMLPMNFKEIQGSVTIFRGDIIEKNNLKIPTSILDYSTYFDACLKIPGLIPNNVGSDLQWDASPVGRYPKTDLLYLDTSGLTAQYYYNPNSTSVKIIDYYNTENYIKDAKLTKEWADKGYWSKSALVNRIPSKDTFIAGRSGVTDGNLASVNGIYSTIVQMHPEWKVKIIDSIFDGAIDIKPYIQNGISINNNSKNPERALMMLDLFRNDQRYFDLTFYGIKGKHYKLSEDGKKIIPLDASLNFSPEGCCPWGWRNDKLVREIVGGIPNYDQLRKTWEKKAISHPIQGFRFDDTNVKNEEVAVNNLQKTYGKVIDYGFEKDVDASILKFREMLSAAGRDRITEEMQKQLDVYMKNLN
jgi:putative aldouronate transport system substrate-binding protein